jgi:hypothetical protein
MLFDAFGDLNWLAVIVATIVWFILGSVWYTDALFGKQWREATGVEMDGPPGVNIIVGTLVLYFITAVTLGLIAVSIGADDFADGLVLGLVANIGFIGVNRAVTGLYEGANTALMKINASLNILAFAIMGVILALWN